MNDQSKPKKERRVKVGDIIFIAILLLGPGIRGYGNWEIYENVFLFSVIGLFVYSWVIGDRSLMENNRRSPQDAHHNGES